MGPMSVCRSESFLFSCFTIELVPCIFSGVSWRMYVTMGHRYLKDLDKDFSGKSSSIEEMFVFS